MNDTPPVYEIERELQASVPRPVRDTRETRKIRRVAWNTALAGFCALFLGASLMVAPLPLLTLSRHPSAGVSPSQEAERTTLNYILGTVLVVGLAGLFKMESRYASRRHLLRRGEAAVATIVQRRERDGTFYLTYRFDFSEYKIYGNEVAVMGESYERYPEGAPITVLFPSHESYASELYVAVTQAEIVGAAHRVGNEVD